MTDSYCPTCKTTPHEPLTHGALHDYIEGRVTDEVRERLMGEACFWRAGVLALETLTLAALVLLIGPIVAPEPDMVPRIAFAASACWFVIGLLLILVAGGASLIVHGAGRLVRWAIWRLAERS
jgi:hypothetical protein